MATDIDSLQIEINAKATKANDAIDILVKKIDKLRVSLNTIGSGSFNGVTKGLKNLNTALTEVGRTKVDNLQAITSSIKKMSSINADKLSEASSSLRGLSSSLEELSKIHVDTTNLSEISTAISILGRKKSIEGTANLARSKNDIIDFVNGLNSVGSLTFDFESFQNLLSNLSKLGGKSVTQAATNLKPLKNEVLSFVNGLNTIKSLNFDSKNLTDLIASISKMGGKSVTQAIANIPLLSKELKRLMSELSSAPRVSQNIIDMTNALAKLSATGTSSGRAVNSLKNSLDSFSKSTKTSKKHSFSLASAIGKVYATYWLLFRAMGKIKESINISSQLTEVQNVVDVTFGEYSGLVDKMAKTSITDFGMSELTVKQISSRFQAMGTAIGFSQKEMAGMSIELTKLAAGMASFYDVEQSAVAKSLQAVFSGETEPLRKYGLDLTNATLQEWAMKNGIDAKVKSMSQAEKTLLRYQYVMANTGAAQGDFARTADTWANKVRVLKQSFEALGATLGGSFINFLKPIVSALNVVIAKLQEFAVAVSNSLGKIFGWKYESGGGVASDLEDGVGAADDIASGLGDAANNAKKLKDYALGIDELNVINPDSDSGSSGGSSGGGLEDSGASGSVGQWIKDESLFDYESELDNLYKLGEFIGESLRNTLENIDWNGIYEKARNFGTGLADFLNGLISPELFGSVGTTIASALNAAIYAALAFGETFDFEDFGLSIATGINEFFDTFDFEALAESVNTWVQGIWNTLTTAISEINWLDVYDGIITTLENLDIETVATIIGVLTIKKIGKLILDHGLISFIGNTLSGLITNVPIILSNLKILFGGGLIEETGIVSKLANALALAAGGAGTLKEALVAAFGAVSTTVAGVLSVVSGAILAVVNFFSMWTNGFSWLKEALMLLGTAVTAVGAVILGVAALPATIVAAVVAAVSTAAIVIHDNWDAICALLAQFAEWFNTNVIIPVQEKVEYILLFMKGLWIVASSWFYENVISPIINLFLQLKTKIEKIFTTLWAAVQKVWHVVSNWYNDTVIVPLLNLFDLMYQTVSNLFSVLWSKIMEVWNGVSKWFDETVITPVQKAFEASTGAIGEVFDGLWKGIKSGVITAMNAAISTIESAVNWIIDSVNDVIDSINSIGDAIEDAVDIDVPSIPNIPRVSLGRIPAYEIGGFPEDGLFMANHTELVGQFSNGKTAVANNEQIIAGIKQGVYEANSEQNSLVREMIGLLQDIRAKNTVIKMNGKEVGKGLSNSARRQGYTLRTSY